MFQCGVKGVDSGYKSIKFYTLLDEVATIQTLDVAAIKSRGPFPESPDNFSGPESYFMCTVFAFKTQIVLALKAE